LSKGGANAPRRGRQAALSATGTRWGDGAGRVDRLFHDAIRWVIKVTVCPE